MLPQITGPDCEDVEVGEMEKEPPELVDSSLQSLARSWSRAASFPVAELMPFDQQTLWAPSPLSRRASNAYSCMTETEKPPVLDDSNAGLTWSLLVEDARADKFSRPSYDAADRLFSAIDETTALLSKPLTSAHALQRSRSSTPQTVFNLINLTLGIGFLGIPLALKHAGLLPGLLIFTASAVVTLWTARMIERCLNHDPGLRTYGDLACAAFGPWARVVVTMLVAVELTTASVGQIILFSDGIKILLGGQTDAVWKVICGAAFIPLSFAPLRYLGVSSALCVFCFFIISTVMLSLGVTRPSDPGSLHTPAQISILPSNFFSMVGCVGMPLAAWGGHTVFPELYDDMRRPEQFFDSVKASYAVTFPLYLIVGIVGYLMFGNNIKGPITSEILSLKHSPFIVSIIIIVTVTFFPIAKIPLNIRPLSSAINRSYDLHTMGPEAKELDPALMRGSRHPLRTPAIRALIGASFVALAIMFPNLDDVMSVLGVVAGLLIAVILPICFYLSILGDEVSSSQRHLCIFIIAFSSVLAVGSLACTFARFS